MRYYDCIFICFLFFFFKYCLVLILFYNEIIFSSFRYFWKLIIRFFVEIFLLVLNFQALILEVILSVDICVDSINILNLLFTFLFLKFENFIMIFTFYIWTIRT